MRNQVLNGDSAEVLKIFPDKCFDACVTDPPYGLGTKEPTGAEIDAFLSGREGLKTGDFMGKDWDIPSVALWREVYRTMKPGAVLMSFAGTRTLDLMAAGIEAAGFRYLGVCGWVQGQGFPKGVDVQYQAMLKAGICLSGEPVLHAVPTSKFTLVRSGEGKVVTALGLAQIQPEGERALLTGTGKAGVSSVRTVTFWSELAASTGLNIESSWKAISDVLSDPTRTSITETEIVATIGSKTWSLLVEANTSHNTTHGKKTQANGCKCHVSNAVSFSSDGRMRSSVIPVRVAHDGVTSREQLLALEGHNVALKPSWEPVLCFTKGDSDWQVPAVPFFYCAKAAKSEKNVEGEVENNHVTVKPQKLMAWLVSVAAPKGSLILEPFLGSGTTAAACAEQGRDFVGIERDPHYFEIASKRVGIVKGRADELQAQRDLFDLAMGLDDE
jgi:DNA modification methylase